MNVSKLKRFLSQFNSWDYPELDFNSQLFKFTISYDGFMVLGPDSEAGEMIDILNTMDDNDELITAVAMRVDIYEN